MFRRVLMALQPGVFQECFFNWLGTLRAAAAKETGIEQPVLAIDGKTLRSSHDKSKGLDAKNANVALMARQMDLQRLKNLHVRSSARDA